MFRKKDLSILESVVMLQAIKENFGKRKAAQKLCISIDTLNRYLNDLETELGSKLVFIRNNRAFLTMCGENLIKVAEQIERCLQNVYDIKHRGDENSASIRVVFDRDIYFPQMSFVCKIYPQITFYFDVLDEVFHKTNKIYDLYLSHSAPEDKDAEIIYKREFSCGFFASKEYLKMHKKPDSYEELLKDHRLILKQRYLDHLYGSCLNKKQLQIVSDSSFIIMESLRANSGIGIMPLFKREYEKLVYLKDIACPIKETIYLIARKSVNKNFYGRMVLEYYTNFLEKMLR